MKNIFLEQLHSKRTLNEICDLFEVYGKLFKNCKIICFNLVYNPNLEKFKNYDIEDYFILGVSDYENSLILDNSSYVYFNKVISVEKILNLDLNILTYLKKLVIKNSITCSNFFKYLKFIKENKYRLNMSISLIERTAKPIDSDVWKDYIFSYVKYDSLSSNDLNRLCDNLPLEKIKEKFANDIFENSKYKERTYDQFYIVACLVIKAFELKLIKNKSKEEKCVELLNYSLNELNIYAEFELYILFKYLIDDDDVSKFFGKIQSMSNNIVSKINSTAWDIVHIRLVELQMLQALRKGNVEFHYIGTKDKGLKKLIKINPIRFIGVIDDENIIIREYNILYMFPDKVGSLLDEYKSKRIFNTNKINYEYTYKQKINYIEHQNVNR